MHCKHPITVDIFDRVRQNSAPSYKMLTYLFRSDSVVEPELTLIAYTHKLLNHLLSLLTVVFWAPKALAWAISEY